MNTRLRMNRRRRLPAGAGQSRGRNAGFTLVELLAVITVMAILAGILVPVIFSALNTANEFTITSEVQQLDAAVEKFKTQYGFYPPTFNAAGAEIQTVADMRRYLNRISPNHNEGDGSAASRLGIWWTNVGQYLDERSSLVFWLSGLAKNKQYPLSGYAANTASALKPYKIDELFDGTALPVTVERDEFFEFDPGRLQELSGTSAAGYQQPAGAQDGDLFYRYRDSKSYGVASAEQAYFTGYDAGGNPNFVNPESFQIASPGMDGLPGGPLDLTDETPTAALPQRDDNIANFADGRIEKFVNENL